MSRDTVFGFRSGSTLNTHDGPYAYKRGDIIFLLERMKKAMHKCLIFYMFVYGLIEVSASVTTSIMQQQMHVNHVVFIFTASLHGCVLMMRASMELFPQHIAELTKDRFYMIDNWILALGMMFLTQFATSNSCSYCVVDTLVQSWWAIAVLLLLSRAFICISTRQIRSMVANTVVIIPVGNESRLLNLLPLMHANSEECGICLDVSDHLEWRLLPCSHYFHCSCVDPWLVQHGTCPVCRFNITSTLSEEGNG